MAFIAYNFVKISDATNEIYRSFITKFYQINNYEEKIKDELDYFFKDLKNNISVFIEYPYVDKVYRDSYYFYFSTKHKDYSRNCIRVTFFLSPVKFDDLFDYANQKLLQDNIVGYCVIRPTFPQVIGRNLMCKAAYKYGNFITCIHKEDVLINGIKLSLNGYPHSSQDQESITCAETTIWALMEYFGHKYAEYKPVLPSVIINKLNERSDKRMLPSSGLTPEQISYALKDFGFGTLIHTKQDDKQDFLPDLSVYIESGIPVIVAVENSKLAHAILMIGREQVSNAEILKAFNNRNLIIPFSSITKRYVVQDDNQHPYSLISLNKPAVNYPVDSEFKNCKITSFVVPLYRKIYMEAKAARKFMVAIFTDAQYGSDSKEKHIFRLFLSSSRSFKNHIARQGNINPDLKEYLLTLTMPRFIYCGEFINKTDAKNGNVSSLIVLDATEASDYWEDSFIFAAHKNVFIISVLYKNSYKIIPIEIPFDNFKMCNHNLN